MVMAQTRDLRATAGRDSGPGRSGQGLDRLPEYHWAQAGSAPDPNLAARTERRPEAHRM